MSETMNIPASVTKKLLAVMADVSYVRKDKKNEFLKYNYASEKAIKEALHPILVKHGLLFLPVGCEMVSEAEIVTVKDGKERRERVLTIRYFYRWVDAETGEASDVLHAMGAGSDSSDKGVYKGLTGAIKYILTGTFLIPTGDDPEREDHGSRQAQAAVAERKLAAQPKPAPTAMPKKGDASEAFTQMYKELGSKLFEEVLKRFGVDTVTNLSDANARLAYKAMAEIRKTMTAASHGEGTGLDEQLFNSLPDASRGKLLIELRNKIATATGSNETATEEYERLREACDSQWALYKALENAWEFYSKQVVA